MAGGQVYVGFGDATVRAFDARTGSVSWTQPVRGFFTAASPLAVRGEAVYALDESGGVYRFDARTGDRIWDYQFPSFVTWSAPLVTASAIYVGTNDGTFAALDPGNGHLIWRGPLSGRADRRHRARRELAAGADRRRERRDRGLRAQPRRTAPSTSTRRPSWTGPPPSPTTPARSW